MNRRHFLRNGLWIAAAPSLLLVRKSLAQIGVSSIGNAQIGIAVAPTAPAYNPQPDILWWKGNTGSGTSDPDSSSGSGPACTLSSASIWGTTFTPGGSTSDLVFNGSSFFANSAAGVAFGTNKLTVEFRIIQTTFASATLDDMYLDSGAYAGTANTWAIYNKNDSSSAAFRLDCFDGSGNDGTWTVARPSNGAWHHVAVIFDNSAKNAPLCWIDGASVTVTLRTDNRANFQNFATRTTYYGRATGGTAFCPGSMKDVRVFAGARTAANIITDATNYP